MGGGENHQALADNHSLGSVNSVQAAPVKSATFVPRALTIYRPRLTRECTSNGCALNEGRLYLLPFGSYNECKHKKYFITKRHPIAQSIGVSLNF